MMCLAQSENARETDTETQREIECVCPGAHILEGGSKGKSKDLALKCSSGSETSRLSVEPEEK